MQGEEPPSHSTPSRIVLPPLRENRNSPQRPRTLSKEGKKMNPQRKKAQSIAPSEPNSESDMQPASISEADTVSLPRSEHGDEIRKPPELPSNAEAVSISSTPGFTSTTPTVGNEEAKYQSQQPEIPPPPFIEDSPTETGIPTERKENQRVTDDAPNETRPAIQSSSNEHTPNFKDTKLEGNLIADQKSDTEQQIISNEKVGEMQESETQEIDQVDAASSEEMSGDGEEEQVDEFDEAEITDPMSSAMDKLAAAAQVLKKDHDIEEHIKSVFLFSKTHPVRKLCIQIAGHKWFDRLILFSIVLNCIFLAISDPTSSENSSRNKTVRKAEFAFMIIFTIEFVIKVIAFAFIQGRNAYLKDRWNWIDFFVIIVGFLSFHPSIENYSAIRTIRVLRPLRTIGRVKSLRVIVSAIIQSIPALFDVLILCLFTFSVFGIFGIELFSGAMKHKCIDIVTGEQEDTDYLCGSFWLSRSCPQGYECKDSNDNPDYGFTNFDNILSTYLMIFRIMSLDNWSLIMYQTMDSTSGISAFYFLILVMVATFFVINLALAVISHAFDTYKEEDSSDDATSNGDSSLFSNSTGTEFSPLRSNNRVIVFFYKIVTDRLFGNIMIGAILINTVFLSIQAPDSSPKLLQILSTGNIVFAYVFFTEAIMKLIAFGWKDYSADRVNLFDGFIALMSITEIILIGGGYLTVFRLLRLFRVVRVLKIFKAFDSLRILVATVMKSLAAVVNLVWVILIFLILFSLVGMQLFGGKVTDDDQRAHFNDFITSMITVFQVLTVEGWTDVMYTYMKATTPAASLYFICLVLFGNYIILYLFLAILINTFSSLSEKLRQKGISLENSFISSSTVSKIMKRVTTAKVSLFSTDLARKSSVNPDTTPGVQSASTPHSIRKGPILSSLNEDEEHSLPKDEKGNEDRIPGQIVDENLAGPADSTVSEKPEIPPKPQLSAHALGKDVRQDSEFDIQFESAVDESTSESTSRNLSSAEKRQRNLALSISKKKELEGKSLKLFSVDNPIRLFCHKLVTHAYFDTVMLWLIIASSISLAFYQPDLATDSKMIVVLDQINIFFTAVFFLEFLLKVVTYGAFLGEHSYFRDPWNVLDAFVVMSALVGLFISSRNINSLKVLRVLRALRPLRLLNRNQGMKIVINAILLSVPAFINVMIVSMFFWLVFAILGVQLFGGQFQYCQDEDVGTMFQCHGIFVSEESQITQRIWDNEFANFDNVFNAMKSLFVISTFDDWVQVMYMGIDAAGYQKQPRQNYNPYMAIYFIAFIIFGGFFVINLFVSVLVDNFHQLQKEYAGHGLLTSNQRHWVDAQKLILQAKPARQLRRPEHPLRKRCFKFVRSREFEFASMVAILLNMIVMMAQHDGQSATWDDVLWKLDILFIAIFSVESALKFVAYGNQFFIDFWCVFDLSIVILSITRIIIQVSSGLSMNLSVVRIFRIFRVFRILRLIKSSKTIYKLFRTLVYSFPSLANIAALLFLVFFIFSVLGMSLFGSVRFTDGGLDEHVNFRNFLTSLLTLFRIMTFDNWSQIYQGCSIQPPLCSESVDDCGAPTVATIYFVTFCLSASFILLNIYIAIILENFSIASDEDDALINEQQIEKFCAVWTDMADHNDPNMIPTAKLDRLLRIVGPPLGVAPSRKGIIRYFAKLDIPDRKGFVHYLEVLRGITRRLYKANDLPDSKLRKDLDNMTARAFPNINKLKPSDGQVSHAFAALTIQRYFRQWKKYSKGKKAAETGMSRKASVRGRSRQSIADSHQRQRLRSTPSILPKKE
eukprot:TRINITY_DN2735_c0_g2_i2.p1 TRINITY_DN2735_c0_g2~~TRINITY_DN2735_c0_g2_i2.p1  ORF type:complete len:1772 (-),score=312.10 TRINITY_DN2735_c0_g2_i2:100-5415(-)